jgi:hypothetical protein
VRARKYLLSLYAGCGSQEPPCACVSHDYSVGPNYIESQAIPCSVAPRRRSETGGFTNECTQLEMVARDRFFCQKQTNTLGSRQCKGRPRCQYGETVFKSSHGRVEGRPLRRNRRVERNQSKEVTARHPGHCRQSLDILGQQILSKGRPPQGTGNSQADNTQQVIPLGVAQREIDLSSLVIPNTQNMSMGHYSQLPRLGSHSKSRGVLHLTFLPALPSTVPVGERLQNSLAQWQESIIDPFALSIVTHGYKIPLLGRPPLTHTARWEPSQKNMEKARIIRQEVESLLHKRAIQPVTGTEPGFYSHMFLVRKNSGGWRPVMDLTRLNQYVVRSKFRMVTSANIREVVQQHDWLASLDLTDAYLHIPMHYLSRKFLRFSVEGKAYEFRVLPFGLTTAPYVFTKVLRAVVNRLQSRSVNISPYLDDWLFRSVHKHILVENIASH